MKEDATNEDYMRIVPAVIKVWKRKFNFNEYLGCLEISKEGYKHVHMYLNTNKHVLELEKDWIKFTGTAKGSVHQSKKPIETDEHVQNIFEYIRKDPIYIWSCDVYKAKYNWKSGLVPQKR